ncbi:FAD-dependent oxidoreductase [Cryptosporangium phraense]|uniref:FAD-dependent oxidoreductase n=1 Tax=Cryptosporangium phraense TaxID=2593070 RepID=UPI00197AAA42|nr:FAD-dependent oxidoreductase [Cryptosporangium phraense]
MDQRPLRVAVVGSGPSGIYAAEALTRQTDVEIDVDVLDRLPTPFGLVRYGVAPDHLSIRGIRETLWRLLRDPSVRFLGNVELGTDLTVEELRRHYDAVVYTFGASADRRLGIPGEDLPGSLPATDVVAWYCGHPDAARGAVEEALLTARSAVVVGVGNVALDVGRVLARCGALDHTDMPEHVLSALGSCPVRQIHLLGRRSPAHAAFTTKELRELGKLEGVSVRVDPADLAPHPATDAILASDRAVARNVDVLRGWAEADESGSGPTGVHLRFFTRPVEILGRDRVEGVVVERTALADDGSVVGTGERSVIEAQLVVRSVGYRGVPMVGLPFDSRLNVVPHEQGRVVRDGVAAAGEYVAGWIKRGPSGVIGTNKADAHETVATLLEDATSGALPRAERPGRDAVTDLLAERGVRVFTLDDWRAIDAAEIALGESRGRARTTLATRDALLDAVRATMPAEPIN